MTSHTIQAHSLTKYSIAITSATSLLHSARRLASEMGIEVALAITDAGGHLKAFEATDGVPFLATDVAIDKAWTAVSFGMPTHVWGDLFTTRPDLAQLAHRPRLVAVGGGYPIIENGHVIGGLGVSGGSAVDDQKIAIETLTTAGFQLP